MAGRKRNQRRMNGRVRGVRVVSGVGALMRSPRARRLGWRVTAVLLAAVALAGLARLLNQPITRVTVTGRLQHVSPLQVEQVVRAHLGHAGFVTVNLGAISQGLSALPWVASAAVQRSWPQGLTVQVVEQSAVARWNGTGLVNAAGVLFLRDAPAVPDAPVVPAGPAPAPVQQPVQLAGPDGSQQEVTARYLSMQAQLQGAGLRLTTLSLDARGAWKFTLADGVMVRLGREQVDQRFGRFMLAGARLVRARATGIAYVDMRYGNGFAVGWKGKARHAGASGKTSQLNG